QSVRVSLAAPFSAAVPLFSFPRLCPPRSTLFPYTTLFRSVPFGGGKERTSTVVTTELCQYSDCFDTKTPRIIVSQLDLVQATEGDRKSTRLNSSHVKISYAVFCLKKKKSLVSRRAASDTQA